MLSLQVRKERKIITQEMSETEKKKMIEESSFGLPLTCYGSALFTLALARAVTNRTTE